MTIYRGSEIAEVMEQIGQKCLIDAMTTLQDQFDGLEQTSIEEQQLPHNGLITQMLLCIGLGEEPRDLLPTYAARLCLIGVSVRNSITGELWQPVKERFALFMLRAEAAPITLIKDYQPGSISVQCIMSVLGMEVRQDD